MTIEQAINNIEKFLKTSGDAQYLNQELNTLKTIDIEKLRKEYNSMLNAYVDTIAENMNQARDVIDEMAKEILLLEGYEVTAENKLKLKEGYFRKCKKE